MVTYVPVPGWLLASRTMQSGISLDQLQKKHIHTYIRILLSSCVDAEASCIVATFSFAHVAFFCLLKNLHRTVRVKSRGARRRRG